MKDFRLERRWLVIDMDTAAELHQWEGVHRVYNPVRYRWELRLHVAVNAADYMPPL